MYEALLQPLIVPDTHQNLAVTLLNDSRDSHWRGCGPEAAVDYRTDL